MSKNSPNTGILRNERKDITIYSERKYLFFSLRAKMRLQKSERTGIKKSKMIEVSISL